jgi:ABC-type bacteriocin/lantibiotic exporter with double-glycine peptidase domain
MRRLRAVLEHEPTVQELPNATAIRNGRAALELQNVAFRYRDDANVLNGITLRIEPGEAVGITGRSGSGKTTLARLIPRLQDPTSGQIMLNGQDIRYYRLHSLRSKIAYVHQEPVLFSRTIKENLLLANPLATEEHLWDVLNTAMLDQSVRCLAAGVESQIGPMGARLSGGERQRLIIARALLMNPSILILDEATAAIDQATERNIVDVIRSRFPEMAVILISHRRSSLELMDRVLVLHQGGIQRDGPPGIVFSAQYDDVQIAAVPLV